MKNLLVLLVAYNQEAYVLSKNKLEIILKYFDYPYVLKTLSNSPYVFGVDFYGSNKYGEFSGWFELLGHYDLADFGHVLFVNDTLWRHFGRVGDFKIFKNCLHVMSQQYYICGDKHYSIDYSRMFKKNKFALCWVRTSFFMMDASSAIRVFSLLPWHDSQILNFNPNPSLSASIPFEYQSRILNWLFPPEGSMGWHSASIASNKRLQLKAQCIFFELYLTKISLDLGIKVIPAFEKISFFRWCYYELCYFISTKLVS